MTIFEYIIPQEWILRCIIALMVIMAIIVAKEFFRIKNLATANLEVLKRTKSVDSLAACLEVDGIDAETTFRDFEESCGRNDDTKIVFEHIQAIFSAGLKGTRLDAKVLIDNSIEKIFKGVDFVKSGISLFLVFGILGTLFGLATSIGAFTGEGFVMGGSVGTTANELTDLFQHLRGAFAPSIWGVTFTIIFVFAYSSYIQEKCVNNLKDELTENTIRYWLPRLYPTDFQKGSSTLVKLNSSIKNAEGINSEVSALQKNLSDSNATLKELSRVSDAIKDATRRFEQGTEKITQIKALYDQLESQNVKFGESIEAVAESMKVANQEAYQAIVAGSAQSRSELKADVKEIQETYINGQELLGKRIEEHIEGYKTHMDMLLVYMKEVRGAIDNTANTYQMGNADLVSKLASMVNASDRLVRQNTEINNVLTTTAEEWSIRQDTLVKAVTKPIIDTLQELSNSVARQSIEIANSVDTSQKLNEERLDVLQQMADGLRHEAVERYDKATEKLLRDLQDTFTATVEKQSRSQEEQLLKTQSLLEKTGKIFDGVTEAIKAMTVALGKSAGMSQQEVSNLISKADIVRKQEKAKKKGAWGFLSAEGGFIAGKGNMLLLAIILLLLASFGTQIAMVHKLSSVQEQLILQQQQLHSKEDKVIKEGESSPAQSTSAQPASVQKTQPEQGN